MRRVLMTAVLFIIGLGALLASVCGGIMTISALINLPRESGLLVVSVPSLVIGALIVREVGRQHRALDEPDA